MYLSRYRFMWIQVVFDLPVMKPEQRKAASEFRNDLLDLGFEMVQFSVYHRCCSSKEAAEVMTKRVQAALPRKGKVQVLCFTDQQFANIQTFYGKSAEKNPLKRPEQLSIF